jgi:cell division protein ZapE
MQKFYNELSVPKKMVHYQQFMQETHKKMHGLQGRSAHKIIQNLAKGIASRCNVICMDEFEIKDITDAMIIMHLFEHLQKQGVFIFITTNTQPDNLYKDGLQRLAFLPFIEMVKNKFEILHLDTDKDYRFEIVANIENRVLFLKDVDNAKELNIIKDNLCNKDELSESKIEVFGRDLVFKKAHNNILVTDFSELFERDLGYGDYVALAKKFEIIILSSVRAISEEENNLATRFINFIDNVYFNRVLLFIEIACKPEEIYIKGSRKAEFERTVSRLYEINSKDYALNDKIGRNNESK